MATTTSADLVRMFGTPNVNRNVGVTQPAVGNTVSALPGSPSMGDVPKAPAPVGSPPPTPSYAPSTPPVAPAPGGAPRPPVAGAPAPGGVFRPQSGGIQADPAYEAFLRERMVGGGMMGMEEFVNAQANPLVAMMNREFERAKTGAYSDLARRGVVDSGETVETISDMSADLGERSAALRGQFGAQYEQMKQSNINSAMSQFGNLQNALISSKTAITTANIGAAAQVQSASISAGATVAAAQLQSNAALQAAGMNYDVAIKRLDRDMEMVGIDPERFKTDPVYRGDMLDYLAMKEKSKMDLEQAQTLAIYGGMVP